MARDPLASITTKRTPQSQKARTDQVKNSAGGYTFKVSDEDRLRRFLVLGTDGGTYYTSEQKLTQQNAQIVVTFAMNAPRKLVDVAVEISTAGRAPKNNPAIFALAAASRLATAPEDRAYANSKLSAVCRTGTHLFTFAQYAENLGGWGPSVRKAVSRWYTEPPLDKVAYQAVKYRQRDGWTHRDLLRLAHPKVEVPDDAIIRSLRNSARQPENVERADLLQAKAIEAKARKRLFDWLCGRDVEGHLPPIVTDFLDVQNATTAAQAVAVIERGNGVTWELLPTELLNQAKVWEAMIERGLPMTALVRQLPRLTNLGVTKTQRKAIVGQLSDQEAITKSRMHPVNILMAMKTYASGASDRGSSVWTPDRFVVDALDGAFYKAFGNVEPAGKDTLIALDVSGSMDMSKAGGTNLTPREASGSLALVTMATEPSVDVIGFTGGRGSRRGWGYGFTRDQKADAVTELSISPRQRLDDVIRTLSELPMGATDCALPFIWAEAQGRKYETVVCFTDNETWFGAIHPHQALEHYRQVTGINTKLIVVGLTATDFSIADPTDPGSLNIAGLDSAVPNLIADFSRGL